MVSQRGKMLVLRIGLVIATAALVLGGVRKYRSRPSPQDPDSRAQTTGLYVNPESLNFGEVWEDNRFAWVLPIENRSPTEVTIDRFYNSCVCTEILPPSLVIPAGERKNIPLTIDLMTEKAYDCPPQAIRDFTVGIAAVVKRADGKEVNQTWEIRGRVKTAIQFEEPAIDFGMHSVRSQPLRPKRITVRTFTPLDTLAVSGRLHYFPVRATRQEQDSSRFDLEIVPLPDLPAERYKFDISVVPILPGGRRLAAKNLPVFAWLVSDIQASPPEVVFGAVPVGEAAETTITLHSLTERAFTVDEWNCTCSHVTIEPELANTGDTAFRVKWSRVNAPGQQQAEAVFRIRTSGEEDQTVKVPVKCFGIQEINRGSR